jgi:hypothetical protein
MSDHKYIVLCANEKMGHLRLETRRSGGINNQHQSRKNWLVSPCDSCEVHLQEHSIYII